MWKKVFLILAVTAAVFSAEGEKIMAKNSEAVNPVVTLKTSLGDIKIELYPDKAPVTVQNFLSYT